MFKQILVATDFSEPAAAALRTAIRLAEPLGARVALLHVVYADKLTETLLGLDAMEYLTRVVGENATAEEGAQYLRTSALEKLRGAIADVAGPPSSVVEPAVVEGRPSEEIVKFAEQGATDLIVVGTNGRGAIGKAFLGSVADHVIRLADCPVMVVRQG